MGNFFGSVFYSVRLHVFIDCSSLTSEKIEDFHPQKSIVVTPDKMATFYAKHSVDDEVYPLISKKGPRIVCQSI